MIEVRDVTKKFGTIVAVDNVSFMFESGIFTLLGPSGCGKSTLLRCIAGLEVPETGFIKIGDKIVTDMEKGIFVPPYLREVGFVFQNYALWPHMTVYENVSFGLKVRKLPKEEVKKRVRQILELVGLSGFENRYPFQLSGGQQQRVALARSLVYNPQLLLLDEPLSNLDAKIRESVRSELRKLLKSLGVTAVYVTHDQEEAFAISDRIAVMNAGRIVQEGTPQEIYEKPRDPFVVEFIGRANIFEGTLQAAYNGEGTIFIEEVGTTLKCKLPLHYLNKGSKYLVVIRPSEISLKRAKPPYPTNVLEGLIIAREYRGGVTDHRVKVGEKQLIVTTHKYCPLIDSDLHEEKVYIYVPPEAITLVPTYKSEANKI
jgi:iron(III) transport system ATP-binding protein